MVYDFGLMKGIIKDLIDSFDHAITFWDKDDADYVTACKNFSARWIALPVSPSAEQFSRVFFFLVDAVLKHTNMQNGEGDVTIHSVIVHETDTGYAQCFREDIENVQMGELSLADIVFSEQVKVEWAMSDMYDRLKNGDLFDNPTVDLQVKV
jgi:6-pyruvoyltetrahydropterin/6-carboxytetrahydropterin synthase